MNKEVEFLIAGPNVYICNECVELCDDIIKKRVAENKDCQTELSMSDLMG